MSVLSKLIYSFNPNPIKIPAKVPIDIDKISLIFIWKGKGTRRMKTTVKGRTEWEES